MHRPVVSIIIPSYNAGPFLRPAVESILRQTYSQVEVWVIDDGSTDGSVDQLTALSDSRLNVMRQENSGKPAALNSVISRLQTPFYALQDADDLSHPERIERQVECMLTYPELAASFTGHDLIIGGKRLAPRSRAKRPEECRRDIERFAMPAHDPTGLYRMDRVRDERYDPQLPIVEGYDYILRIGERHPMMVVGECLYSYRVRTASVTRRDPLDRERLVQEVVRRACERRNISFDKVIPPDVRNRPLDRNRDQDNNIVAHMIESTLDQKRLGHFLSALWTALYAASMHPLDSHYYKPLAYWALPLRWLALVARTQRSVRADSLRSSQ